MKLYNGDCLEIMDGMADESVDMILCDLPYGTTRNKWDSVIPFEPLWEQYERIIKPRGAIVLNSQGIFTAKLIMSNEKLFKYKIVWVKSVPTNFLNAKRQPLRQHEDICVFYKRQPDYHPIMMPGRAYNKDRKADSKVRNYGKFKSAKVARSGGRNPTDVIYCKTAVSEKGKTFHPTQKPVTLGRYLIRTFTKKGDVVLDNCFGSGAYLVAAAMEGRDFIGIEQNQEYFNFTKERLQKMLEARERLSVDMTPTMECSAREDGVFKIDKVINEDTEHGISQ